MNSVHNLFTGLQMNTDILVTNSGSGLWFIQGCFLQFLNKFKNYYMMCNKSCHEQCIEQIKIGQIYFFSMRCLVQNSLIILN